MLKRLLTLAVLSCLAFGSATYDRTRDVIHTAAAAFKNFAVRAVDVLASPSAGEIERQAVPRERAKSFLQRILKRERPHVTPGWRMCPST